MIIMYMMMMIMIIIVEILMIVIDGKNFFVCHSKETKRVKDVREKIY